jgi:hypothetical protein
MILRMAASWQVRELTPWRVPSKAGDGRSGRWFALLTNGSIEIDSWPDSSLPRVTHNHPGGRQGAADATWDPRRPGARPSDSPAVEENPWLRPLDSVAVRGNGFEPATLTLAR